MKQWFMMSPFSDAGSRSDPDSEFAAALRSTQAWKINAITKDNLGLNDNILAFAETELLYKLENDYEDFTTAHTMLGISCFGHSSVLTTKIVSDRSGIVGDLVRMGHLHENGKLSGDHVTAIRTIVGKRFRFTPVNEFSDASIVHQAAARCVLHKSRPAGDLNHADENYILAIDNSNWDDSEFWEHLCLGPKRCAAQCGGKPERALQIMISAALLSAAAFPSAPLEYRWKGVEAFSMKVWRGQKQHNVLKESHSMLWPESEVRRALRELEATAESSAESPNGPNTVKNKTCVRGGKTVTFLSSAQSSKDVERLVILQSAAQGFLNKCFSAEKAVSKYSDRLLHLPAVSGPPADSGSDLAELRELAIQRNLHILSGDAGIELLCEYSSYFDFNSNSWNDWGLSGCDDDKYTLSLDMITVMQDAFFRLVARCDVAKFQVLEVGRIREGTHFDVDAVQAIASELQAKFNACPLSVDKAFTWVWIQRLMHSVTLCRKAHTALRDLLAVVRVTSTRVERKHLVGQELMPTKRRGAGLDCDKLGLIVFQKLLAKSADNHRDVAYSECVGDSAARRRFSTCLTEHCCDGHEDRRSELARGQNPKAAVRAQASNIASHEAKSKLKTVRGYDMYVRSNYTSDLEGATVFEKRKALDVSWKALGDVDKAAYQQAAYNENERLAQNHGEDFPAFVARTAQCVAPGRHVMLRERFQAIQVTLDKLMRHPVFSSGAAMHDFSHGFKSDLIATNMTREQVRTQASQSFGYDFVPIKSPNRLPRCFCPCSQSHGGLCCTMELMPSVVILTHNIYAKCSRWKPEFPILLEFKRGEVQDFAFLGRLMGAGELAMLSRAVVTHVDGCHGNAAYDYAELVFSDSVKVPKPTSFPVTSHRYLVDFLVRAGTQAANISELTVIRHKFRREPATKFRVGLMGIHTETEISCLAKIGVKRNAEPEIDACDELPFGLGKRSKTREGASTVTASASKPKPTPHMHTSGDDSHLDSDADNSDRDLDDMSHRSHISDNDCDPEDAVDDQSAIDAGPGPASSADSVDPVEEPPPVDEPWNCCGIKCWDIAGSGRRAACAICESPIVPGCYRLDYRFKQSKTLGDQRRLHPECSAGLPVSTRERDLKFLQHSISLESTSDSDRAMLRSVAALLR